MTRRSHVLSLATAALLALAVLLAPSPSRAFCGFYVGGAGAKLFNDATVVVLMREGTRTVLSMQNALQGPAREVRDGRAGAGRPPGGERQDA